MGQLGTALSTATSFVYTQPGSYTILQSGSGNGSGAGTIACKEITVLPVDPVTFTVKGCSSKRALLVPDASTLGQYDLYEIAWGDGVREQKTRAQMALDLSHTYSNTGTFTVTLQGLYSAPASCGSSVTSQSVTVYTTGTQPVISALKVTSANSIEISYQAGAGATVQLYQKVNGAYTATGQTGSSAQTFTVQTDATKVQCFEVVTQDACNTPGLTSDEVCSLVLDVKANNQENDLTWQPYAGTATQFRFYRIYRNGSFGGQVTNVNTGTYADPNNIVCGTQYCYSLEATVGPTTITSAAVCVNGINGNPPAKVGSTIVSIENNQPRLVTTLPTTGSSASYTLIISRATGGSGNFQQVATLENSNVFVDENANPSTGSYCYKIAYRNNCGLTSEFSDPVCTVFLDSQTGTGIDWTAQAPFNPETVTSYSLEIVDSLNGTQKEVAMGGQTHYTPDPNDPNLQSQRYRILAFSSDGSVSYSNYFTFRREVKLFAPDAFTPNNDGMNDTFLVGGVYVDNFSMTIYDRWGEVVYHTVDKAKGWDGTVKGQNAMAGQYMYKVEVTDLTGVQTVKRGAVLLIR